MTDLLLIVARLYDLSPFLARSIGPNEIMLNDNPVEYLWHPETDLALLAQVPADPLEEAQLWTAPFGSNDAEVPLERVREFRTRASRAGQTQSITFAPAVQAGRVSLEVRVFDNRSELQRYARDLVKRLQEKR